MQSAVAKLLRDGPRDELGERDLEEDLMAHLTRQGFSADLVLEQASSLLRAREFIAKAVYQCNEEELAIQEEGKVEEEVSEEEAELEGRDEEWSDWRVVVEEQEAKGSSGTDTRQAEVKDKTGEGNPEAIAAEIPLFAKRVKTRVFSQFVPVSPGSQKTTECAARAGFARQSKTT